MAYQKRPSKGELLQTIAQLEKENRRLTAEAEAAEREQWERKKPQACEHFHKTINGIFPGMVCKVTLEHIDRGGYWFTFELKNDPRRQTYAVRHNEL